MLCLLYDTSVAVHAVLGPSDHVVSAEYARYTRRTFVIVTGCLTTWLTSVLEKTT